MKKLIASAFLVIALFSVSMVCASAVAQDPSTGNGFTVVGTAHFVPYSGEVDTASALSDIVAALMSSDQALDYLSVYNSSTSYAFMPNYVVNIKYNSTHNCYGIFLTSKSYSGWLHTGSATAGRYMIYCPPEKFEPDLLYSISRATSAISSKVSTISDTLTSLYNSLQSWFGGQLSGIYYWTNSINLSASRIDSALTSFFGNNTVSDIISAIPAAPDLSNIESTLSSINNKLDNLPSSSGSAYDDSALLAALQPITSFYQGGVETVVLDSSSGTLAGNIQFERGTFSLLSLNASPDADVFFLAKNTYYLASGLSFASPVRSSSSPTLAALGPTMTADADHITVTVKKTLDLPISVGTYDIQFFDTSGDAIALKTGDCFLPGSEVGVWQIRRAEGGYITIGSTTGLPDGFEFSDLFYSCVRFKVSDINSAPALFSYWLDYFYNTETYYSRFRIVSSADSTITFRYSTLHPVLAWLAQRQNGFQTWLGNKLDNLSASSGSSDLTSVTTRLDTIIEQLQTTSGETACDHTYVPEVTQAPTCILPGLQVSTCSQCGNSYSEILAALGHDWQCTSHVETVTDPDTGEVTQSGYDIYTCSRCGDTYNDYAGDGAPSDYGDTSISKIIVKLFSKLGTFAGKIISWIIGLFDKMLSGLNDIITQFSDLTAQITGFGGDYPVWLSGFWGILPQEFQLALTFSFVCVFIGIIGRKLFFA